MFASILSSLVQRSGAKFAVILPLGEPKVLKLLSATCIVVFLSGNDCSAQYGQIRNETYGSSEAQLTNGMPIDTKPWALVNVNGVISGWLTANVVDPPMEAKVWSNAWCGKWIKVEVGSWVKAYRAIGSLGAGISAKAKHFTQCVGDFSVLVNGHTAKIDYRLKCDVDPGVIKHLSFITTQVAINGTTVQGRSAQWDKFFYSWRTFDYSTATGNWEDGPSYPAPVDIGQTGVVVSPLFANKVFVGDVIQPRATVDIQLEAINFQSTHDKQSDCRITLK